MAKHKTRRVDHLLNQPIDKQSRIAFVCSFCLGDSLISMVTVNNLIRNGYNVTVFGDYVYALRDWFTYCTINPALKLEEQQILKDFDVVLHMYEGELSKSVALWHPLSITLSDSILYLADLTMTDIQVTLCRKEFKLENVERINHIQPLSDLSHRVNPKRIVIHPTSSLARKDWPAKKFLKLSEQLHQEGFAINFIVSPKERPDWEAYQNDYINLPSFSNLSDVAKFIYESGYFIGNDSGIGHLASNLGIPTVSIILRKGVAKQWRPTWAPGKVVLSPNWLNPRPIKEKLWKVFTRVKHVKKAFDELQMQ
jgi:heptosyltransferase III